MTSRIAIRLAIGMAALAAATVAHAGDDTPDGFRSPSDNIHCMFEPAYTGSPPIAASVRCDIRDIADPPPRPRSCEGDWGRSFAVAHADAAGRLICAGDALFSDRLPVLDYGTAWQHEGFTCLSEKDGVSCFNARRHGFKLSRGSRATF